MFERIVMTWPSCSRGSASAGMALQQQSVLLHQAIDALGVDGLAPADRRSRLRSAAIRL